MAQTLALVSLVVRDYDEALDFFVGKLRFELVEDRYVPEQAKRWLVVSPPGAVESRLLLARASNPAQASRIGDQTAARFSVPVTTIFGATTRPTGPGHRVHPRPTADPDGTVAVFLDLYGKGGTSSSSSSASVFLCSRRGLKSAREENP